MPVRVYITRCTNTGSSATTRAIIEQRENPDAFLSRQYFQPVTYRTLNKLRNKTRPHHPNAVFVRLISDPVALPTFPSRR